MAFSKNGINHNNNIVMPKAYRKATCCPRRISSLYHADGQQLDGNMCRLSHKKASSLPINIEIEIMDIIQLTILHHLMKR